MLTSLNAIPSEKIAPTKRIMKKYKKLLNYAATQPGSILTYQASDMVIAIHNDVSYLNEPKARSRVGGHHFISSNTNFLPNNGAVMNISQIIKAVMLSDSES